MMRDGYDLSFRCFGLKKLNRSMMKPEAKDPTLL
jgi:hypothetical protein